MNTDLTVAICAYNCEKFIEETLDCIFNQTYKAFKILIVNDCSTDNSLDLIHKKCLHSEFEYEVVSFETNKGLAAGRRFVSNYVQTEFLLFVDADDCPFPYLIEKLYSRICSDNDLMAVGCYHEFIDENSKRIGGGIFVGAKTKEEFYIKAHNKKLIFMQPTAIIRLDDMLRAGGPNITGFPDGKPRYQDLCEDLDLWTRMSDLYIHNKAIVVIPEVLSYYRKHLKGLSNNSYGMILRMRHIKINLLRRRNEEPETTFQFFLNGLSELESRTYQNEAEAADTIKQAIFLIKDNKVLKGLYLSFKVLIKNPKMVFQKLRHNVHIFNH